MSHDDPPSGSSPAFFRVGDFLVRPTLKTVSEFRSFDDLSEASRATRLPDKALAVLLLLAENQRQVCPRDFLLDQVWGQDRSAFDRVLDNAISEIRRAFGDSAKNPEYIATIPKQGYRLIAEVQWPGDGSPPGELPPRPASTNAGSTTTDEESRSTELGNGTDSPSGDDVLGRPVLGARAAKTSDPGREHGRATAAEGGTEKKEHSGRDFVDPRVGPPIEQGMAPAAGHRPTGDRFEGTPPSGDSSTNLGVGRTGTGTADDEPESLSPQVPGTSRAASESAFPQVPGTSRAASESPFPQVPGTSRALPSPSPVSPSRHPGNGPSEQSHADGERTDAQRSRSLRWLVSLGLLALTLALASGWWAWANRPPHRLYLEPLRNESQLASFDSLQGPLTEALRQRLACPLDHVDLVGWAPLANVHLQPVLSRPDAATVVLELRRLDAPEGTPADNASADQPGPILAGTAIELPALVERAAESLERYFDRRLCTDSSSSAAGRRHPEHEEAEKAADRASHCFRAGHWLAGQQRYPDAVELFEAAIAIRPDFFDAYDALANTQHILGADQEAVARLDAALALDPDPTPRLRLERRRAQVQGLYALEHELLRELRKWDETGLADRASGWWLLTHAGDCRSAQARLRDALASPDGRNQSINFAYLGMAHLECAQVDEARGNLTRYVRAEPYNPNAHKLAAEVDRLTGRHEEAREGLRKASTLDPRHLPTLLERARIELDVGNLAEADLQLEALLPLARWPNDRSDALELRAWVALRRGDTEAALPFLAQAQSEKLEPVRALWLEGLVYIAAGEPERVAPLLARMAELRRDVGTAWQMELHHHLAGQLALARGRPREAIDSLLLARNLGPDDRSFFVHALAEGFAAAGQPAQALDQLAQALRFNPSHIPSLCLAAELERERDEPAKAFEYYSRARQIIGSRPEDPAYRRCMEALHQLEAAPASR